ncbi:MAG: GNAT family N-acetyltransferase [Clostridia bacterium]|nr:GNAT family N-acetyltransferase [Clostridia bacterium]
MTITKRKVEAGPSVERERWEILDAQGGVVTSATFCTTDTRFCDSWIRTLQIGGVSTQPVHRRAGHVRELFTQAFREARDYGWAVSHLHPFSFAYYRKFGYERICDHLIVDFPVEKLDFVPRGAAGFEEAKTEAQFDEARAVYNAFSAGRMAMPRRVNLERFPVGKPENGVMFLHRNGRGEADAYITFTVRKEFCVNRLCNGVLTVKEFAYENPDGMRAVLGFLRMYEGEVERVHFENLAMTPEIDFTLRHYMHTAYQIVPDIMARILDPEALLRANAYPRAAGSFALRVTDPLDVAAGAWRVRYGDGEASVERLDDGAACDIVCDVRALAPLMYGAYELDARLLGYMDGVRVDGDPEDFLRAFPKRPRGVFEHF